MDGSFVDFITWSNSEQLTADGAFVLDYSQVSFSSFVVRTFVPTVSLMARWVDGAFEGTAGGIHGRYILVYVALRMVGWGTRMLDRRCAHNLHGLSLGGSCYGGTSSSCML